jgi:hypothetical protein
VTSRKLRLLADSLENNFITAEDRKGWASDLRGLAKNIERSVLMESVPPRRRQIGIVAIDLSTGKASSGAQYTAGAKVYTSEAVARAALRFKMEEGRSYRFVPAFIEVEQ